MDDLNLISFVDIEVQTSHLHPITGTPCDVPEPKTLTIKFNLDT